MSKLEQLIKELCPNGVDYIPISELGTLTRGKRFVHADAVDKGIPCIHYGELYTYYGISTYTTKSFVREELKDKLRYAHKNDVIIVGAGENDVDIGIAVAYLGDEDVAIHDACYILTQKNNPKYISYCLRTEYYHSQIKKYVSRGKICAISAASIGKAELPIPPLEIQDEIVHILDEYSEKTEKLCKELDAELTARKKQYEYYRDLLLDFGVHGRATSDCEWKALGEIGLVTKLAGFEFTNYVTYSDTGKIVALRGLNVKNGRLDLTDVKYIDKSDFSKLSRSKLVIDDMLFTYVGTIGQVALIDENDKYYLAPNVALIRINQEYLLPRFAMYFFQTKTFWAKQIDKLLQSSSMKNIPMEKIRKFKLPVPPIEEQERIVSILDRFDKLCNDISEGLPAEIEARRKQYEYYRDKLLSFEEVRA